MANNSSQGMKDASSTCLNMTIDGKITLTNVPKQLQKTIANNLQLKNPSYEQAIRTNPRARYALSKYIKYYEFNKKTNTWIVGRGVEDSIRRYCDRNGIEINCRDLRKESPISITTSIRLRDYQRGVPEEVIANGGSGLVQLSTGFGKTLIALEIIKLLGQKALIVIPKLDLLNQFVYEIKKWTNVEPGIIQGKNMVVKEITVATIQSLKNRIKDGSIKSDEFGCVIVDEAHMFVPKKSREAIQFFSPKYLIGQTATDARSDGQGKAIKWIFGDKIANLELQTMTPTVKVVHFTGKIPVREYAKMIDIQIENEERNKLIIKLIKEQLYEGRKSLVLCKRVKHHHTISNLLKESCEGIIEFRSSQTKEERDELLKGLRKGTKDFNVIVSSFGLWSTGLDLSCLDTLFLVSDLKSEVLLIQSAGRIRRLFTGKKDPLIIDIADVNSGILKHQSRKRQKTYAKLGWRVV